MVGVPTKGSEPAEQAGLTASVFIRGTPPLVAQVRNSELARILTIVRAEHFAHDGDNHLCPCL
jgi:hypothetical protein